MRTAYYNFKAGGFGFRIYRPMKTLKGWTARVMCGGWAKVVYPHGQRVICPTRREMQAYLLYAYTGIEPKP